MPTEKIMIWTYNFLGICFNQLEILTKYRKDVLVWIPLDIFSLFGYQHDLFRLQSKEVIEHMSKKL